MLDRYVELVPLGVFELHVLALLARVAHQAHAEEAPDAVVDVDHQVARLEVERPGGGAGAHHAAPDPLPQPPEEIGVPVNLQLVFLPSPQLSLPLHGGGSG